jgi:hypothetical protein
MIARYYGLTFGMPNRRMTSVDSCYVQENITGYPRTVDNYMTG